MHSSLSKLYLHLHLLNYSLHDQAPSTASTIRASTPEVQKNNARMRALRLAEEKEAQAKPKARSEPQVKSLKAKAESELVTPPSKAKKADNSSAPKMPDQKKAQDKAATQAKCTAAKAAPKAKAKAKAKAAPEPPPSEPVKAEVLTPKIEGGKGIKRTASDLVKRSNSALDRRHNKVAEAVHSSLARSVTAKLGPSAEEEMDADEDAEEDAEEKDLKKDDPQSDRAAVEAARIKRVNHARFMRFSRSIKSCWAASICESVRSCCCKD